MALYRRGRVHRNRQPFQSISQHYSRCANIRLWKPEQLQHIPIPRRFPNPQRSCWLVSPVLATPISFGAEFTVAWHNGTATEGIVLTWNIQGAVLMIRRRSARRFGAFLATLLLVVA